MPRRHRCPFPPLLAPDNRTGNSKRQENDHHRTRQQPASVGQIPRWDIQPGYTCLNIPTGVPLVYELDDELKPIRHYYLGDSEAIAKAMAAVANQGRAK